MEGWMEEWLNEEWKVGLQRSGSMKELKVRWMGVLMEEQKVRCMVELMDKWKVGQMGGLKEEQKVRCMDELMDKWKVGWLDRWMDEWIRELMSSMEFQIIKVSKFSDSFRIVQ